MSIDSDIAILEQVPMLRVLGRSALRLIAMAAETRDVAAGETLFKPGERIDCAYVVQQGSFVLNAAPGLHAKAMEAGPGTMLGEFALMSESARPFSATAQAPSAVMRISRSMFVKILDDDADAALRLRNYVARRAQQSIADVLLVRDVIDPQDKA